MANATTVQGGISVLWEWEVMLSDPKPETLSVYRLLCLGLTGALERFLLLWSSNRCFPAQIGRQTADCMADAATGSIFAHMWCGVTNCAAR